MAKKPVYYYYRVDKHNRPMVGSNFRSNKILYKKDLIRYIPQSVYCCDPEATPTDPNTNKVVFNTTKYYYVKLDERNNPIDLSLFKSDHNKWIQGYQQIFVYTCCAAPPPPTMVFTFTSTMNQVLLDSIDANTTTLSPDITFHASGTTTQAWPGTVSINIPTTDTYFEVNITGTSDLGIAFAIKDSDGVQVWSASANPGDPITFNSTFLFSNFTELDFTFEFIGVVPPEE